MEWRKTVKRLCRKLKTDVTTITVKAGFNPSKIDRWYKQDKITQLADALEITEEIVLLEALRDSPNLPDQIRTKLIDIINELNPSVWNRRKIIMLKPFVNVTKNSVSYHIKHLPDSWRKRQLFRRIMVRILIYEIGLSHKSISQLLPCGMNTINTDTAFLDDPEIVKYAEMVKSHVANQLEIIK